MKTGIFVSALLASASAIKFMPTELIEEVNDQVNDTNYL